MFGFVYFCGGQQVAASGIAGLTLILHNLWHQSNRSGYLINFRLSFGGLSFWEKSHGLHSLWDCLALSLCLDFPADSLLVDLNQDT